jgi:Family of unknown function (DUF5330)
MFLVRIVFWLVIVIMLLPTNRQEQTQVLGTAEATVKDVGGFCDRNPDVCAKGQDAFHVFLQKARFGADMVAGFVKQEAQKRMNGGDMSAVQNDAANSPMLTDPAQAPAPAVEPSQTPQSQSGQSQNTLLPSDLAPAWRGPSGT